MAVSGQVASHAPAGLTPAQIVGIYKGTSPTGTRSAAPPASSRRRSRRPARARARSSWPSSRPPTAASRSRSPAPSSPVQEHDPAPDPGRHQRDRAVLGRPRRSRRHGAAPARPASPPTVRSTTWCARPTSATPTSRRIFGEDGFVCSEAARTSIEAAGFKQLATAEQRRRLRPGHAGRHQRLHHQHRPRAATTRRSPRSPPTSSASAPTPARTRCYRLADVLQRRAPGPPQARDLRRHRRRPDPAARRLRSTGRTARVPARRCSTAPQQPGRRLRPVVLGAERRPRSRPSCSRSRSPSTP